MTSRWRAATAKLRTTIRANTATANGNNTAVSGWIDPARRPSTQHWSAHSDVDDAGAQWVMRWPTACEPAAGQRRDPPDDPERHPPPGRAHSSRDGAGPAVEELTPAVGIHPERGVGATGEQHRATGQSGETDVLRVPIADGLVPADLVIADASHREHRPERHGRPDTLAEHGERARSHQRGHVEQQARLFVPALGAVPRLHRHHGVGMRPRHRLDVVEKPRRGQDVGVDEQQRRCGGGAGPLPAGMRLAEPTRRRCGRHDPRSTATRDRRRAVVGLVVDDDELVAGTELGDDSIDDSADRMRLVACRHDHRQRLALPERTLGTGRVRHRSNQPSSQPVENTARSTVVIVVHLSRNILDRR